MWIDRQEYIRLRALDTVYRGEHQSLVEANNRLIAEIESLKKPGYVLVPEVPTEKIIDSIKAVWPIGPFTDMAQREYAAMLQAAKENDL